MRHDVPCALRAVVVVVTASVTERRIRELNWCTVSPAPHPRQGVRPTMPQISIVPTGERFAAETNEPVLTAALRAGLNLPHSCKGGHCASCRARILDGSFAYPEPQL